MAGQTHLSQSGGGRRDVYAGLDQIRGLLCLLIVYWHASPTPMSGDPLSLPLAVDVFFILSGFVIAHAYLDRMPTLGAGHFMLIRLIRFYPLFLLGFGIGIVRLIMHMVVGSAERDFGAILAHLPNAFFLPVAPGESEFLFPLNVPAWSLLAELLINAVFALIWTRLSIKVLTAIVAVAGAALVVTAFAYGGVDYGWGWASWPALLTRVAFGFPMGVLLYRLFAAGKRAPSLPGWVLIATLGVLMLSVRASDEARPYWELFFVMVFCPLLVWFGASASNGPIATKAGEVSGRLSYAIYAIHYPIIGILMGLDNRFLGLAPAHPDLFALALIVISVIAAWIADVAFDQPVRRFLTRAFVMRKPAIRAEPA